MRRGGGLSGVLVLDKPEGPTSHDLVARARRALRTRQIGHTGTLDPIATGVLALCIGPATRLSRFLTRSDKVYLARIQLGWETDTQDRTGRPRGTPHPVRADEARVRDALATLTGRRLQVPPSYSAKRIGGVRAHRLARSGRARTPDPVEVEIHRLELRSCADSTLEVEVRCSAGTYVRTLAEELGRALGCGAHLLELRRTRSGEFGLDRALSPESLEQQAASGALRRLLIPPAALTLGMPAVTALPAAMRGLCHGRDLGPGDWHGEDLAPDGTTRVLSPDGVLLAVARAEPDRPGTLHPVVVLVSPGDDVVAATAAGPPGSRV